MAIYILKSSQTSALAATFRFQLGTKLALPAHTPHLVRLEHSPYSSEQQPKEHRCLILVAVGWNRRFWSEQPGFEPQQS